MKIKYFSDTDTALVELSDLEVAETKEINENIYIDLDPSGNLVAMTIEHARQQAPSFVLLSRLKQNHPSHYAGRLTAAADFAHYVPMHISIDCKPVIG